LLKTIYHSPKSGSVWAGITGSVSTGIGGSVWPEYSFVAPNPNNGHFNFIINNEKEGEFEFQISDPMGKVISKEKRVLIPGPHLIEKNINRTGLFFLTISKGAKKVTKTVCTIK
jgi:hypothetical protein